MIDILIIDGKILDMCTLKYKGSKRDDTVPDEDYISVKGNNIKIGDTWDFEKGISLQDSPIRFIEPEPSELELLKIEMEDLKTRITNLESSSISTEKL